MDIATQILILAANRPGTLSNICGTLADANINIMGLSVVDHVDHALVRMVVSDSTRALHLLGESGLPVMEDEIIRVPLQAQPGALEKLTAAVAEAGLNIHYAYATEPQEGGGSILIMKTNDDHAALKVLKKAFGR